VAPRDRASACAAAAAVLLLGLLPSGAAAARNLYVPNTAKDANSVSVIDTATNQVVGSPIAVQKAPFGIAITPDGTRAYVTNEGSNSVSVIDTTTNQVVGAPIKVGEVPTCIAITPDGNRVYVVNSGSATVSAIDTRTNVVVEIPVETEAFELGITPDGRRVYVANFGANSVSVIDTGTNAVIETLRGEAFSNPAGVGFLPDGSRLYVTQHSVLHTISVIVPGTNQILSGLTGINAPEYVAIAPNSSRAYVTDPDADTLTVFEPRTNMVLGASKFGNEVSRPAVTPDNSRIYVSVQASGVMVLDAQGNVLGGPIPGIQEADQLAIVPNQPPVASFSTLRARPGVPVGFDASASRDPDGTVASYAWNFVTEGKTATVAQPETSYVYPRPGKYRVTLTLTDNEGCSTARIFTGQTASCNGSAVASKTEVIRVAYPGVQVRCPRSAKPGGCRYRLQVVSKRGKNAKAQSALARVKLKAGGSTIVSLKPRNAFRRKLARARNVLVEQTQTIDGATRTAVRRLKIVQ
jgi:YVTN family beta-propeller protein